MIDHDRIFKELIKTFFLEFVELFLPDVYAEPERDSLEFLDKEVFTDVTSGEKHEADLIVKERFRGQPWFFHVEAQAGNKKQPPFPQRMFTYFARLHEGHGLPVYPVVIFSYDSPLYRRAAQLSGGVSRFQGAGIQLPGDSVEPAQLARFPAPSQFAGARLDGEDAHQAARARPSEAGMFAADPDGQTESG
jgi:hypothetical protein